MTRGWKSFWAACVLALACSGATAAIEVNQASSDDLESIKGIGPATAQRILQQRQLARFRDWQDFIVRVPGIGEKRAATLSAHGLRVQGQAFAPIATGPLRAAPPMAYAPRTPPNPGGRAP